MSLEDQVVNQQPDTSIQGFLSLFLLTLLISVTSLVIFEVLRSKKPFLSVYSPRSILGENEPAIILPHPSSRTLGWMRTIWNISDTFFLKYCGYDGIIYIRFLRMCCYFTLIALLIIPPILIPINVSGGSDTTGLVMYSMANVPDQSPLLWAHFILTVLLVILLYGFLYYNYAEYTLLRQQYMKMEKGIHQRTVLVTGLPSTVDSSDILASQFRELQMGEVVSASLNPSYDELTRLKGGDKLTYKVFERASLFNLLEKEIIFQAKFALKTGKNLTEKEATSIPGPSSEKPVFWNYFFRNLRYLETDQKTTAKYCFRSCFGTPLSKLATSLQSFYSLSTPHDDATKELSAIDKLINKIKSLDQEIKQLRKDYRYRPSSTGFVTFRSPHTAHILSQVLIHPAPFLYNVGMAPEPRDIIWENLSLATWQKTLRHYLVESAVVALTFFWLIPMSLIAGFATVESLEKFFPGIQSSIYSNVIISFIQNILPNLLIIGFFFVVPYIFQYLCFIQGITTFSSAEKLVFQRLYFFNLFNVLLVFTLASTFIKSYATYTDPANLILALAKNLTQSANIYINFVVLRISSKFIEMLQLYSLLVTSLLSRFLSLVTSSPPSPRELYKSIHPPPPIYSYQYTTHLIVFVITLTFSAIHPMIIPLSLLYYGVSLVFHKYQFLYVYQPTYESGGTMWPLVFDKIIVSMEIWLFTMSGYFFLKQAWAQGVGMLAVCFATWVFKVFVVNTFKRRGDHLAMWGIRSAVEKRRLSIKTGNSAFRRGSKLPQVSQIVEDKEVSLIGNQRRLSKIVQRSSKLFQSFREIIHLPKPNGETVAGWETGSASEYFTPENTTFEDSNGSDRRKPKIIGDKMNQLDILKRKRISISENKNSQAARDVVKDCVEKVPAKTKRIPLEPVGVGTEGGSSEIVTPSLVSVSSLDSTDSDYSTASETDDIHFIPSAYLPTALYQPLPTWLWLPKDPSGPVFLHDTIHKPLELIDSQLEEEGPTFPERPEVGYSIKTGPIEESSPTMETCKVEGSSSAIHETKINISPSQEWANSNTLGHLADRDSQFRELYKIYQMESREN